jgi:hypothetical protein
MLVVSIRDQFDYYKKLRDYIRHLKIWGLGQVSSPKKRFRIRVMACFVNCNGGLVGNRLYFFFYFKTIA